MNTLLATGISDSAHLVALSEVMKARLDNVPVDKVLVYFVQLVTADALYSLAEQFDVLGYRGWALAPDEASRRELIKRAIELHKYRGTPWAIKEALRSIGYPNITIYERLVTKLYDGEIVHDGFWTYAPGHWSHFWVEVDNGGVTPSAKQQELIEALILENKNVRSKLVKLTYI